MARKVRSDIKVGNLEKKLGLAPGSITNLDGSDARSDKKLGTLRKEASKAAIKKKPEKKPDPKMSAKPRSTKVKSTITVTTADQKSAAKRKLRTSPKTSTSLVNKVTAAIRKTKAK